MSKAAGNNVLETNFKNERRVFGALGEQGDPYESGKELVPGITSWRATATTPGPHSTWSRPQRQGVDPGRCHQPSGIVRRESGLVPDVRHGRRRGRADPPQGLRHGRGREDAGAGLHYPFPRSATSRRPAAVIASFRWRGIGAVGAVWFRL